MDAMREPVSDPEPWYLALASEIMYAVFVGALFFPLFFFGVAFYERTGSPVLMVVLPLLAPVARLTYGMWAWHRGRMEGEVSIWVAARHDTGEELSRAGIILFLAAGAAGALSYTRLPRSLILLLFAATWIALVVFGFTRVLRLVRSGREDG